MLIMNAPTLDLRKITKAVLDHGIHLGEPILVRVDGQSHRLIWSRNGVRHATDLEHYLFRGVAENHPCQPAGCLHVAH